MDVTEGLFNLDENCVLFLYLTNDNGTPEYRRQLSEKKVFDASSAAVNIVQWSYPCGPGQWSSDGIEHGNTTAYRDNNGLSIDYNDP